jgi:predicted transcriptional regulator
MDSFKVRYWTTLIQLEHPDDKDKLERIAKELHTSRSRIIGQMISNLVNKHTERTTHNGR